MNVCPAPPAADWQLLQSLLRARLLWALLRPQPDPDQIAQLRQALWNIQEILRLQTGSRR